MSIDRIKKLTQEYSKKIESKCVQSQWPEVKIAIVGEIYVVLEPAANLNTAKKLGQMGAVVEQEISISHWLKDFFNLSRSRIKTRKAGSPYINSFVGGHGQDSVGGAVKYAKAGFDGIIHIAPFTCMPEIVAESIMKEVQQKENISVLTLVFDEHSGEEGLKTRLEAFVDLLARKKKQQLG